MPLSSHSLSLLSQLGAQFVSFSPGLIKLGLGIFADLRYLAANAQEDRDMLLTTLLAATVLTTPTAQDTWELKAPYAKGYESTHEIKINVTIGGQQIEASFKNAIKVTDGGGDKPWKGTINWVDILASGNPVGDPPAWDSSWQADGSLFSTESEMGDDVRRMLIPFTFVYPGKAVAKGEKWTSEVKPFTKTPVVEYKYEVLGAEQQDSKDALKVKVAYKEKADEGLSGESTFWIMKDGKISKFESDVKGWFVPMAGPERVEAKIVGTLKK